MVDLFDYVKFNGQFLCLEPQKLGELCAVDSVGPAILSMETANRSIASASPQMLIHPNIHMVPPAMRWIHIIQKWPAKFDNLLT